jgi:hypothetical protein
MGRRPTSRVTVLSVISELSPINSDKGMGLQVICDAAKNYGITKGAARQQVDALKKLGLIDTLNDHGKMFMVEITAKGIAYLEQNASFIRSTSKPIEAQKLQSQQKLQEHIPVAVYKIGSLGEVFDSCKQQVEQILAAQSATIVELELKLQGVATDNDKLRQAKAQLEARNLNLREEVKSLEQKLASKKEQETGTLRPSQVPKVWRDLAGTAIEQGWKLSFNGGDHIRWCSPNGQIITSSRTPSDHRTVHNVRSQLARIGLNVR